MAKLHIGSAGLNSGAQTLAKKMRTADIKTTAELSSIFEIEETVLESVVQSMKQKGFDPAEPIVLWKETGYVVDGHTRLRAAQLAGITEIPVTEKHFETLTEAQAYTEARQINRRNLSQAEIFRRATCATNKTQHDGTGRTVEKIAKQIGVSPSTVRKARTVGKRADTQTIHALKNNDISINEAYERVRRPKKSPDSDNGKEISHLLQAQQPVQTEPHSQTEPVKEYRQIILSFITQALDELAHFCHSPQEQALLRQWLVQQQVSL